MSIILALALLPNQAAALPAPAITELTNLSAPKLELESPQSLIFYDGGLAGYFPSPQYWRAPVWAPPALHHLDIEHPMLVLHIIKEHRDDCEVPEPGTMLLIAAGLMALAIRRR